MGSSASKEHSPSLKDRIKTGLQDEINQRAMRQREIQMAINVAQARDFLQIYGTLYGFFVTGLGVAKIAKKPVPGMAGIPVVIGGLVLGNLADVAYGNKLSRVNKEVEYILANERARFAAPKQAPFAKYYTEEEKSLLFNQSTAVGDLWPSSMFSRSCAPGPKEADGQNKK